jgi:hypothetical protein
VARLDVELAHDARALELEIRIANDLAATRELASNRCCRPAFAATAFSTVALTSAVRRAFR